MKTILNIPDAIFPDKATAEKIAAVNQDSDPEWTYRAEKTPSGWCVSVYDEEDNRLGAI